MLEDFLSWVAEKSIRADISVCVCLKSIFASLAQTAGPIVFNQISQACISVIWPDATASIGDIFRYFLLYA